MSIRVLHTSDWHLGKKLFKEDRIEEQKLFLNWLIQLVTDKKINILLIAGDIFDVPNPTNTATKLYFDFLEKITQKTNVHILIISGNHDSAHFLQAPASILNKLNIHIYSQFPLNNQENLFTLDVDDCSVEIKSIPYFRSYDLNQSFEGKVSELTKEDYLELLTQRTSHWKKKDSFKIVMAHHAFGPFAASESEHVLTLAGLESIPLDTISKSADYVALGHIHKPQPMSTSKHIYYSGSPIPLRFSEVHQKKVKLLELGDNLEVKDIEIPKFRRLIKLSSSKESIFKDIQSFQDTKSPNQLNDWYEIQIKLDQPEPLLLQKIKDQLDQSCAQVISFYPIYKDQVKNEQEQQKVLDLSIQDIFENYYIKKFPDAEEVPEDIKVEFNKLLQGSIHESE